MEKLGCRIVPPLARDLRCRRAGIGDRGAVGPAVEEKADDRLVAFGRGVVERSEAEILAGVHVGPARKQVGDDPLVSPGDRGVERSHALRVLRGAIHIRAAREQKAERVPLPEERGKPEGREAIVGHRVRAGGILVETPRESPDLAGRARFKDVGIRAAVQEEARDFGMPDVNREEERRHTRAASGEEPGVAVEERRDFLRVPLPYGVEQLIACVQGPVS